MRAGTAQAEFDEFIDRYTPEVGSLGRAIVAKVREIVPPCVELVYDNYNWLVIGFSPDGKPGHAVVSVVFQVRYVSICLIDGASFDDPHGLLEGTGNQVRHIKIRSLDDFERPGVREFIELAVARSRTPFLLGGQRELTIRSISARQRPRRPEA